MNQPRTLAATKILHVGWGLFVALFFILYLPDILAGKVLSPVLELAHSDGMVDIVLSIAFCITPFLTLLAIYTTSGSLAFSAIVFNLASIIFGAQIFIHEFDSHNAMIVLALAIPSLTIVAAILGVITLVLLLKSK